MRTKRGRRGVGYSHLPIKPTIYLLLDYISFNLTIYLSSGMKLIPVAPSLEIADSVVLLKANYPVKRKDFLCLEYRVKAGTTCNLEIKVSN